MYIYIYDYIWLYMTIYDYIWLYMTIYDYISYILTILWLWHLFVGARSIHPVSTFLALHPARYCSANGTVFTFFIFKKTWSHRSGKRLKKNGNKKDHRFGLIPTFTKIFGNRGLQSTVFSLHQTWENQAGPGNWDFSHGFGLMKAPGIQRCAVSGKSWGKYGKPPWSIWSMFKTESLVKREFLNAVFAPIQ